MLDSHSRSNPKAPPYEPYHKEKFKKAVDKLKVLFRGIEQTSLKKGDKNKLKILLVDEAKKLHP